MGGRDCTSLNVVQGTKDALLNVMHSQLIGSFNPRSNRISRIVSGRIRGEAHAFILPPAPLCSRTSQLLDLKTAGAPSPAGSPRESVCV